MFLIWGNRQLYIDKKKYQVFFFLQILTTLVTLYAQAPPTDVEKVEISAYDRICAMENVANTQLWQVELEWQYEEDVKLDVRIDYYEPGKFWGKNSMQMQAVIEHSTWIPYLNISFADKTFYSSALFGICSYIIQSVAIDDTKEAILQLEALATFGKDRFPLSVKFGHIYFTPAQLKVFLTTLQSEVELCQENVMAFCYFLYNISSNHNILSDKTVINPEVAQLALRCLKSIPENSIPSTCTKDIAFVIQQLCKLLFSDEASLIFVVDLCFDPLGEDACLSLLTATPRALPPYMKTKKFNYLHLLHNLSRLSAKREKTREIFEKIVRLLPWKEHCIFLTDTASEWDWKDNGFLQRMQYSFVTKVVTALLEEGARGDLLNVFEIWETVNTTTQITMDRIHNALEEALTNALLAYDDRREFCHREKLLSVINNEKLFKKNAAKIDLLNFLTKRKNVDIHHMVIDLLNLNKMENVQSGDLFPVIERWFSGIISAQNTNPKDNILNSYYHYVHVVRTKYVQKHQSIKNGLEDLVFAMLESHYFNTMIQVIPEIDNHEDLVEQYAGHMRKILKQGKKVKSADEVIDAVLALPTNLLVKSR